MSITIVYAVITVKDLDAAHGWYAKLLGREADRSPMPSLLEWDLTANGGLQVETVPDKAGSTQVTLGTDDLDALVAEIAERGIDADEVSTGTEVQFALFTDPEGNVVVGVTSL